MMPFTCFTDLSAIFWVMTVAISTVKEINRINLSKQGRPVLFSLDADFIFNDLQDLVRRWCTQ